MSVRLYQAAAKVWRGSPPFVRRLGMWLAEPRFMVTAGAVVNNEAGHILLLKHRFHAGSGWGIAGGFIEKGEQPAHALRRELREELNLEVDDVRLAFARSLKRPQQIELVFRARATSAVGALSGEILRAEWFALDNLPPELDPTRRALVERALSIYPVSAPSD